MHVDGGRLQEGSEAESDRRGGMGAVAQRGELNSRRVSVSALAPKTLES